MKFLCCSCGGPSKDGEGAKTFIDKAPETLEVDTMEVEFSPTPGEGLATEIAPGADATAPPTAEERKQIAAVAVGDPGEGGVGSSVVVAPSLSEPSKQGEPSKEEKASSTKGPEGAGGLSPPADSDVADRGSEDGEGGVRETAMVRIRDIGIGPPKLPPSASTEPRLSGDAGLYMTFNKDIGGGTLYSKLSTKSLPNTMLISRSEQELDVNKLQDAQIDLAKNVKADWLQQAKGTCSFIRSAATMGGELEILAAFFEVLPRKSMLVIHTSDLKVRYIL